VVRKPSDVYSVRKLLEDAAAFDDLGLAPGLLDEVKQIADRMDRFNELFAQHGWVVHDNMDLRTVEQAVEIAGSGDLAAAQSLLAEYYGPSWVASRLRALQSISAFAPRMRLAELAVEDYRCERHHACVPVVLSLLDGMVNDVGLKGFFRKGTDLTAWDSIAAHQGGLTRLKEVLDAPRPTTVTDSIDIPYRNGILHGMDLGYDNRMVAAKAWAALFTAADLARRVEKGKKDQQKFPSEASWSEIPSLVAKNERANERLRKWNARRAELIDLQSPAPGTPEHALVRFLDAWRTKKFEIMAQLLGNLSDQAVNARAGGVRRYYEGISLEGFALVAVEDVAPAVSRVEVRGYGVDNGQCFDRVGTARLVYMDESGRKPGYFDDDGAWFVMTWNPWHVETAPLSHR
jgi:hypothetical protein